MLKEILEQAREMRQSAESQMRKGNGPSAVSTRIPRQTKVEMMNQLEMTRRKSIQANRERMERMMAANQAAMQVAQTQKAQEKPRGLLGKAQESSQQEQPRQETTGSSGMNYMPYWYR